LRGSDRTNVAVAARKANHTLCNITQVSIIKEGDHQHAARKYQFMFNLNGISPPEFLSSRGLVVGSTAFQTTNYIIVLRGDRFLYKMCRFIVGIIVAAGYGKVSLRSIHSALQTGSWEESSGLVVDSSTGNNDIHNENFQSTPDAMKGNPNTFNSQVTNIVWPKLDITHMYPFMVIRIPGVKMTCNSGAIDGVRY